MAHTVAINEFEGPFGLLLELVERGRLEVSAISVATITSKYLERTHELGDLGAQELGEFLELGCRLLYIKSMALLPRMNEIEQEDELRQLNDELIEYRRFQQASRELARHSGRRTWQRPVTEKLEPSELPMPQLDLSVLATAFELALKRREPARPTATLKRHLSQAQLEERLRRRLREGSIELHLELDRCQDRLEIIVLFTALLELIRTGEVHVSQANQFAPITIELRK